jgi:hypothetical protein
MKFFKRANLYKASNVSFNPDTMISTSYNWWHFTKLINGKLIFNNYSYSPSTCKHQSKVRALLRDLGLEIDLVVQASKGLQSSDWPDQARASIQDKINEVTKKLDNIKRHKKLDQDRIIQLESYNKELLELNEFLASNNL